MVYTAIDYSLFLKVDDVNYGIGLSLSTILYTIANASRSCAVGWTKNKVKEKQEKEKEEEEEEEGENESECFEFLCGSHFAVCTLVFVDNKQLKLS